MRKEERFMHPIAKRIDQLKTEWSLYYGEVYIQ